MYKTNIYILRLEGGKYYVGKSDNPTKRYQEHLNGSGSAWTKKYPPISVLEISASPITDLFGSSFCAGNDCTCWTGT